MSGVLFVCLGNICRSPTAEGIFRHLVNTRNPDQRIIVDSAGTGGWHIGSPPDMRAQRTAFARGIDLSGLRARKVTDDDFRRFDLIIAMDRHNHASLKNLAGEDFRHKVRLLLEFAPDIAEDEVPDPYYGGEDGFDKVFDMIALASNGLLDYIRARHD